MLHSALQCNTVYTSGFFPLMVHYIEVSLNEHDEGSFIGRLVILKEDLCFLTSFYKDIDDGKYGNNACYDDQV